MGVELETDNQLPLSDDDKSELQDAILGWAQALTKEGIAKRVAAWLVEKHPNIAEYSTWVSVDLKSPNLKGDFKDSGIQIKIYQKSITLNKMDLLKVKVGALLGMKSAGINFSVPVYHDVRGTVVAFGVGVVSPYDNFGDDVKPVFSLSAKVPLPNFF